MLIYQKDLPIRLGAVVVVQTQLSAKTLNMCVYSQLFWKEENKELEACNGPINQATNSKQIEANKQIGFSSSQPSPSKRNQNKQSQIQIE